MAKKQEQIILDKHGSDGTYHYVIPKNNPPNVTIKEVPPAPIINLPKKKK